jgi:putative hemolysin
VFHKAEQEMVVRVLRFADRPVRGIMTPRTELAWLDVSADAATIARTVGETGHTRFVVGEGGLDEVLGVVHVGRLLGACLEGRPLDLRAAVRPLPVVPDSTPVLRALDLLRQARASIALVVDEYGEVEGIVTVADVLEAVVGDLPERRLGEEPAIVRREDGSWLMDGLLAVEEAKLALGPDALPEEASYIRWRASSWPGSAGCRRRGRRSATAATSSRWWTWTGAGSTRCSCGGRLWQRERPTGVPENDGGAREWGRRSASSRSW